MEMKYKEKGLSPQPFYGFGLRKPSLITSAEDRHLFHLIHRLSTLVPQYVDKESSLKVMEESQ
jgi:hypothetical protein